MKKLLLLLFITSTCFGQKVQLPKPSEIIPISEKKINVRSDRIHNAVSVATNAKTSSINLFTGSMNVYGYISSHSQQEKWIRMPEPK